jgi:hypothetical protein
MPPGRKTAKASMEVPGTSRLFALMVTSRLFGAVSARARRRYANMTFFNSSDLFRSCLNNGVYTRLVCIHSLGCSDAVLDLDVQMLV